MSFGVARPHTMDVAQVAIVRHAHSRFECCKPLVSFDQNMRDVAIRIGSSVDNFSAIGHRIIFHSDGTPLSVAQF